MSNEIARQLYSQEFKRNPYPILHELLEQGPIVRSKFPFLGNVWMVSSHAAVNEMLKDRKRFVRDPASLGKGQRGYFPFWMPRSLRVMASGMILRDEPDHRRLRILVEQAFARRSLEQMQPRIEEMADELIQEMREKHRRTGQSVDLMAEYAQRFPIAVIAELLGLPEADRSRFGNWAEKFAIEPGLIGFLKLVPSLGKIEKYLRGQIQLCRDAPRPGLLTELVQAESDGQRLTEDELVAMAVLLLFAGFLTTTHLIGNGMLELFRHRDQQERLLGDDSLMESAINEILRYTSPVQFTKPMRAAEAMNYYGAELEKGDVLMAVLAAANVDPTVFVNPDRFDITRKPNPHIAFGAGIHVCLGMKLAKLEARVSFQKLWSELKNLELAITPEDVQWSKQKGVRRPQALPIQFG
ncbi:Vitamin D(3) 25-hydroxylase [Rubinisphaera italica]|uniref:Vitamin D(3) 25-hydroxylase n=2 Tax=Rubinisphaera italica TaxID=2527969 RepID=A0A5C5XKK4_9PLAN|nr:Vitamin D(3) 25-hydroxylase [Rubinisphaera italica]